MENEADWRQQAVFRSGEQGTAFSSGESANDGLACLHATHEGTFSAKEEVKRTVRSLVERFGLSREDLVSAYDECVQEGQEAEVRLEKSEAVQCATNAFLQESKCSGALNAGVQVNGSGEFSSGVVMEVQEEGEGLGDGAAMEGRGGNDTCDENGAVIESGAECGREENGQLEEKEEVDKMQTLVQSALRVYEASSITQELGQKRRSFTLEEELNLQPTSFAQELLDRDQTVVAQAIKKYMNQYSVPQREVVEKTGLNQSHLSQHFLHGVTMKRSKRVKLYHWFEDDQKIRTGKPSTADGALNSVLESPKVEGSRRRPRWKWSPISTQILTEAFKKNHFPTREQRMELARVCNDAELTMNNGSPIRGPEGDTEGITEQRVNTWFTNRRKGLSTPSPTRAGLTMIPSSAMFTHGLPPLLRAATPTTPTQSYSHTLELDHRHEDKCFSPAPAAMQALVSHIQQVQAATSSGSAVQLAGTPTATAQAVPLAAIALPGAGIPTATAQAVPLAAIALPGVGSGTVLAPGTSLAAISQPSTTSLAPPIQAFTINSDGIPTAVIPPSQLQAILSKVHMPSDASMPGQLQLANNSGGIFTIPMLHPQKVTAATLTPSHLHTTAATLTPSHLHTTAATLTPSHLHTYTLTSSPAKPTTSYSKDFFPRPTLPSSPPLPSSPSPTITALPTFTQPQASLPTIIGSNQVQALLSQLQAQAKLQGTPQVQFNPASSLPYTITLPGASNEDIMRAQALLINHRGVSET